MAKRLQYYFAGFAIGTLIGLLVSYLSGKPSRLMSSFVFGSACGTLALAWAQHKGLAPSPEEANRPITLFTPIKRHDQEPKR